jgi:hypothetical protein
MIDDVAQYQHLLTSAGREELLRVIAAFKQRYGENWLAEFKAKNPTYVDIVDLCANFEFEPAFAELKKIIAGKIAAAGHGFFTEQIFSTSANVFLEGARGDLQILHGRIKGEIDKPRF